MRVLNRFYRPESCGISLPNMNKQHRCTGKETVALISWPWGVTVFNVGSHKRYLIIYAIDIYADKPLYV